MYRVHCPMRQTSQVNVIERAVLGLSQARITDPEVAAGLLNLHPDLIRHVHQQLMARSLLENRGNVTPGGVSALEYEEQDWSTYTVAHVFQDPYTTYTWPLVLESLPSALDQRWTRERGDQVQLGSRGAHQLLDVHRVVPPEALGARQPDEHELLQVIRGRRRYADTSHATMLNRGTHRIGTITLHPEPTFLLTFVSVPDEAAAPFVVEDLFGAGPSARLQRLAAEVAQSDQGLETRLASLMAVRTSANANRFTAARAELLRECRELVVQRLTLAVLESDQLFAQLIELEAASVLSERDGRPEDRKNTLVAAQKALELVLDEWRRTYPVSATDRQRFRESRRAWFDYVQGCAASIGARAELPERLTGLRYEDVDKALTGKGVASLRTLLVVAIVSAMTNDVHPLRVLVDADSSFIHRVDEIATLRNRSAHANEEAPVVDQALDAHATVMEVVTANMGLTNSSGSKSEMGIR
jgi:hypothetical protein